MKHSEALFFLGLASKIVDEEKEENFAQNYKAQCLNLTTSAIKAIAESYWNNSKVDSIKRSINDWLFYYTKSLYHSKITGQKIDAECYYVLRVGDFCCDILKNLEV